MASKLKNKNLLDLQELPDGTGAVLYAVKDGKDYKLSLSTALGVQQLNTGTGLTGGPITAVGTVALNSASIASLAKADTAVQPGALSTVATSGSYNDLTSKPTIPAAQVNSDWNSVTGLSQILNKPSLATVATSGSYADLTGKPVIPAAQVNADWNAISGVAQILNKPALNFEPSFSKGNIIAGNNVSISGTLTGRLVGAGDITINAVQPPSGGGSIDSVTASSPLISSGGVNPNISIQAATGAQNGYMSAADKSKLDGVASGATANTGTVTSVGMSVPTGFSVSGGTITTSGTHAISYAGGYQGYTSAEASKLAGIAAGATANTGTVTSVGISVPTGFNPGGAVTTSGNLSFSYAAGYQAYTSAEATKLSGIAAGATANTGTVTSVGASGSGGIAVSGSPVTSSGSFSISTTGNLANWSALATTSKQETIQGNGLTKVTCSSSAPGALQVGELYLQY